MVRALDFHLEPVTPDLLETASDFSIQCRLLTNDALTVAVMRQLKLTHLVTNDDNFDVVTGIVVWKPR